MSRQSYVGSIGFLLVCTLQGAPHSALEKRLARLEKTLSLDLPGFERNLWLARKPPVSNRERTILIGSLPEEGHVRIVTREQADKIRALEPLFEVLDRRLIYHIQVINVPQAFLGLHERTVILLSVNALDLLSVEELCAVVAHEAGHEFFWDEYTQARAEKNELALRRIELLADAAAVLVLHRLQIDASFLITALRKLSDFNESHLGVAFNTTSYPSRETRSRQIQDLRRRLARQSSAHEGLAQVSKRK